MDKAESKEYDLNRYAGTTRDEDAVIETEAGDVHIEFFEIKEEFIDKELQHQAADFIWYASKETLYETKLRNIETEINALKGSLWKIILRNNPNFRVKDIEVSIEADTEMSQLRRKYSEIDHAHRQWTVIRKALEMKARMIQSHVGLMRSRIDRQLESNRGFRPQN